MSKPSRIAVTGGAGAMPSVRTPRLRRHLAWVIVIKVMALTALWWLFFRSELRPPAGSAAVAAQILADEKASPTDNATSPQCGLATCERNN